jgi:hypothetical protein
MKAMTWMAILITTLAAGTAGAQTYSHGAPPPSDGSCRCAGK